MLCSSMVQSNFESRPVNTVESLPSGKKNGDQRLIIDARVPNTAFEAPDPVALATRISVDTNDPIFVGVDIYAGGVPRPSPFKICSHSPSKRGRLILLASSTKGLWTPGVKLCTTYSLWFLWVGIRL